MTLSPRLLREKVARIALGPRRSGWTADSIEEITLPDAYPYANEARAWAVLVSRCYHELLELPAWVNCGDNEKRRHNYDLLKQQGITVFCLTQMDIVLWAYQRLHWYVFPCAVVPRAENAESGTLAEFRLCLPKQLPGEQ